MESMDMYSAPQFANEIFRFFHYFTPFFPLFRFLSAISSFADLYQSLFVISLLVFIYLRPAWLPLILSMSLLFLFIRSRSRLLFYSLWIGTENWAQLRFERVQQRQQLIQYLQSEDSHFSPATKLFLARIQKGVKFGSDRLEALTKLIQWENREKSLRFCLFCAAVAVVWPLVMIFQLTLPAAILLLLLCVNYGSSPVQLSLWALGRVWDYAGRQWEVKKLAARRIPKID